MDISYPSVSPSQHTLGLRDSAKREWCGESAEGIGQTDSTRVRVPGDVGPSPAVVSARNDALFHGRKRLTIRDRHCPTSLGGTESLASRIDGVFGTHGRRTTCYACRWAPRARMTCWRTLGGRCSRKNGIDGQPFDKPCQSCSCLRRCRLTVVVPAPADRRVVGQ